MLKGLVALTALAAFGPALLDPAQAKTKIPRKAIPKPKPEPHWRPYLSSCCTFYIPDDERIVELPDDDPMAGRLMRRKRLR